MAVSVALKSRRPLKTGRRARAAAIWYLHSDWDLFVVLAAGDRAAWRIYTLRLTGGATRLPFRWLDLLQADAPAPLLPTQTHPVPAAPLAVPRSFNSG